MNARLSFVSLTVALATSALSSVAMAADLAPRTYTKAPMMSPATNWSGFYGGVNVGYGWANNDTSISDVTPLSPGASGIANQSFGHNATGAFGGGQIGYNWQMGTFVTGLEADIQGSGIRGTATQPNLVTTDGTASTTIGSNEEKIQWFGTVRGRLGVTLTPNVLLYGTGGLAYGETSDSSSVTRAFPGASTNTWSAMTSSTRAGWVVGAGAEWMFAHGWSAKLEYLHVDLGNSGSVTAQQVNSTFALGGEFIAFNRHDSAIDTVRAGVNYHFN